MITTLKCAAPPECSPLCQRPLTLPLPHLCSLGGNQLCGLDFYGQGTYTAEGITKLCEGLKGSAVTSLECATPPRVFAFLSTPLDTPQHPPTLQCSQSARQQPRSGRSSCSRQGPHRQLDAAIAGVGRPAIEPAPECSLSCQRPLALTACLSWQCRWLRASDRRA